MIRRIALGGFVLAVIAAAGGTGGWSRPWGWKVTRDASGACEVSTPAEWQLGREFFLKAEPASTDPRGTGPRRFPPRGLALWGMNEAGQQRSAQATAGKRFQMRTSLVRAGTVCSVWQIKETSDFTAAEKSVMEQVGKTLRWVRP